jgi:hypothetical protein
MSAASCTPSCAAVAVARMGPTSTGVSNMAGSWLRKQVRMYSAIPRATTRPSVSRRSRTPDSRCRSRSAAESSTGRMVPSEGGAPRPGWDLVREHPGRGSLHRPTSRPGRCWRSASIETPPPWPPSPAETPPAPGVTPPAPGVMSLAPRAPGSGSPTPPGERRGWPPPSPRPPPVPRGRRAALRSAPALPYRGWSTRGRPLTSPPSPAPAR